MLSLIVESVRSVFFTLVKHVLLHNLITFIEKHAGKTEKRMRLCDSVFKQLCSPYPPGTMVKDHWAQKCGIVVSSSSGYVDRAIPVLPKHVVVWSDGTIENVDLMIERLF